MRIARWLFGVTVLFGLTVSAQAGDAARGQLTFIKVFKNRTPEYVRVTLMEGGQATYQGGSEKEPGETETFQLSNGVTGRLFALAAALNYFRGLNLEVGKDVADMGRKTFVYKRGAERSEVTYNYTQNQRAAELQQFFEAIARGRYLLQQLEARMVYDRLGMLEVIRQFESAFNAGELVDPGQFVPVLERIAADRRLMRLARTKAQALLRRIRGAAARFQFEYADENSGWYTRVVVDDQGPSFYEHRRFSQSAEEQPLKFPEPLLRRLRELLRVANYFRGQPGGDFGPSRTGYRLTYEAGMEHHEVVFLRPPDAVLAEIVHLVERVLRQEDFRERLRAAINEKSVELQVLLQDLETAVRRDDLADPKEFVSLLEELAGSGETHPLVRQQTERLLELIRTRG